MRSRVLSGRVGATAPPSRRPHRRAATQAVTPSILPSHVMGPRWAPTIATTPDGLREAAAREPGAEAGQARVGPAFIGKRGRAAAVGPGRASGGRFRATGAWGAAQRPGRPPPRRATLSGTQAAAGQCSSADREPKTRVDEVTSEGRIQVAGMRTWERRGFGRAEWRAVRHGQRAGGETARVSGVADAQVRARRRLARSGVARGGRTVSRAVVARLEERRGGGGGALQRWPATSFAPCLRGAHGGAVQEGGPRRRRLGAAGLPFLMCSLLHVLAASCCLRRTGGEGRCVRRGRWLQCRSLVVLTPL